MKYSFVIISLLLIGCSHQQPQVNYSQPVYVMPPEKDNFDKAGQYAADTSRCVWDHASEGYKKVTSEEYKKMYYDWYDSAKRAYNAFQAPETK